MKLLAIVSNAYKDIRRYEEQVEKMREKIKRKKEVISLAFIPLLRKVYSEWEPKIGEMAMLVDFIADFCFEVKISYIDSEGKNLKADESEHCGHRFNLEPDPENYETATFILPMHFYEEIKKEFDLQVLETWKKY
jgi:hypothetical protein